MKKKRIERLIEMQDLLIEEHLFSSKMVIYFLKIHDMTPI